MNFLSEHICSVYCLYYRCLVHCSCALAEDVYRLKSEMISERKQVKFYQAMLEKTQEELENMQVFWLFEFDSSSTFLDM